MLKTPALKNIHSPEQKIFCDLIRRLREEKGVTQTVLAERLKVPQSFVSKVETGERRLDILELRRVCGALQIPFRKFVDLLEAEIS